MAFDFSIFEDASLEEEFVEWLVDEESVDNHIRFGKLWNYYRNEICEISGFSNIGNKINESSRSYVQAQECGLPARITGLIPSFVEGVYGGRSIKDIQRKEVVIENDIAWRINAMVDFLFGKGVNFTSKAPTAQKRAEIESILKAVFASNGALGFLQDMAVLGSVYGFVDCIVKADDTLTNMGFRTVSSSTSKPLPFKQVLELSHAICLELVEAPRALPILYENDYRRINYYVQSYYQVKNSLGKKRSFLSRLIGRRTSGSDREITQVTEILGPQAWQRYENKELIAEGMNILGIVPVVHIQNIAQPYYYEGLSDVEPLIPLQDELNTRLSDRANRITFQSFKMYLAKGVEGFEERPVSPGRMWYTDNMDAGIEEFGGDVQTPSEDFHISEIREAFDKASGVTPVAAGILKNRIGNLTSAVALRMTLLGMLSKTERKRFTYGQGLKEICRMILYMLDATGAYRTELVDRELDVLFPSPLPENMMEKLKEAQIKRELGISQEQVLRELGYETTE
ncbi:MAG: phage portal protein [Planctomycetota bacterium]